ncbi:hypothetical protein GGI07_000504 [Coemansia sp. Benny D115]|nr:hypothetical protein GGI07_000504 [Coemansia sp. Benny D115]
MDATPIFVFDGPKRSQDKSNVLNQRRSAQLKCRDEYELECQRTKRIEYMQQMYREEERSENAVAQVKWLQEQLLNIRGGKSTIAGRLGTLERGVCVQLLGHFGVTTHGADDLLPDSLQDTGQALEMLARLGAERLATLARRAEPLTPTHLVESQDLLASMGYATCTASGVESEALCASLTRNGVADAVCSEDLDVLAFGGRRLLRGVGPQATDMVLIDGQSAQRGLGLRRKEFVDLCILCGTDFASTLEGVGPVGALKLMREYGSIEGILDAGKWKPRDGFTFIEARRIFSARVKPPFVDRKQVVCTHNAGSEPNADGHDPFAPASSSSSFVGGLDGQCL